MNKFLKSFSITMLIVNILILLISILALTQSEKIGAWLLQSYENVTEDLGNTVEELYGKIKLAGSISSCFALAASVIQCILTIIFVGKNESSDTEPENLEEDMAKLTKEEKLALKAAKKEAKAAKKAAAKKVAKTAAVGAAEAVVAEAATENVAVRDHVTSFLESLKAKK